MGKIKYFGSKKTNKVAKSLKRYHQQAKAEKLRKQNIAEFCKGILVDCVDSAFEQSNERSAEDEYDFTWGSEAEYKSVLEHNLSFEKEMPKKDLEGYRVVEIDFFLKQSISLQYSHSKKCTLGRLEFHKEKRSGLVSTFEYKCNACKKIEIIHTEDVQKDRSRVNTAAVWGTLSTGSTYTHLSELLSVMGIPRMSGNMFYDIQTKLGWVYETSLWENMRRAGKEEHTLAAENGDIDEDGIPFITVVVDGGWSKRSYGHSYTANSGVAVIIGRRTGKLLYLGVRNKFCVICAKAENKNQTPKAHLCFKNWTGSSTAMEADIIVEGFKQSISCHHLRYKKIIADGDSTVFSKIRQEVDYGLLVEKSECTNHGIKNYGKHLHQIKKDTKNVSLAARKILTADIINSLAASAQKAIYTNAHGDIETLKQDLRNSPNHVFGHHSDCREYLCDKVGDISQSRLQEVQDCGAHHHIYGALNSLVSKAHLLIDNETNNRAELFMSLLARFTMGKRLNLIQRGSFNLRSCLTGLNYNNGPYWHLDVWNEYMGEEPSEAFRKFMAQQGSSLEHKQNQKTKSNNREPKRKVKEAGAEVQPAEYGPDIAEVILSDEQLKEEVDVIVKKLKIADSDEQARIEARTKGQFSNPLYCSERAHRLTASKFGSVIKRRDDTSCDVLVKSILSLNNNFSTPAIEFGKRYESVAISKFEEISGKKVFGSGLFVDLEFGFLGASPDGIISENEIVEVKCSYKVAKLECSLEEAVRKKAVPFLKIVPDNGAEKVTINEKHDYYFQIQGQLAISRAKTCYFIVYSGDKNELFIEEVQLDSESWKKIWRPKLVKFFENCIAPEIVLNRRGRNLKCRDPPYIAEAQKEKKRKLEDKENSKSKSKRPNQKHQGTDLTVETVDTEVARRDPDDFPRE